MNLTNIPSNVIGGLCMNAYAGQVESQGKLGKEMSMKIE
jgi:hypothetical protein